MTYYTGTQPLAGLSPKQSASIDAAATAAPDPSWRDGFRREVAALLGEPPYSDLQVVAAIKQSLADLGLASIFDLEGE